MRPKRCSATILPRGNPQKQRKEGNAVRPWNGWHPLDMKTPHNQQKVTTMTDETLPTFTTTRSSTKTETESSKTSKTTAETSGASTDSGAHLDTFVIPENDEDFVDPDAPQEIGQDGEPIAPEFAPDRLDKAAFFITFKTIFQVPAMLDTDFAPLAIQREEMDQARAASDAAYDLLEIWYPAALEPNSESIAHLMIVVPFLAGKVMLLRMILEDKRNTIDHVPTPQPTPEPEVNKGAI